MRRPHPHPYLDQARHARRSRGLRGAWPTRLACYGALLAIGWGPALCAAHESPTPSASIVQREAGHYVLVLNLDVSDALRRTLQPANSAAEFQAVFGAMAAGDFAAAWARVTAAWARACRLEVAGQPQAAVRWRWPTAQEAQARIRERLMHDLTQGQPAAGPHAAHGLHTLVQAQAEYHVAGAPQAVPRLLLHPALRPLSLTSYRPHQQWVGSGDGAIALRF